jgi:hypothetical protein
LTLLGALSLYLASRAARSAGQSWFEPADAEGRVHGFLSNQTEKRKRGEHEYEVDYRTARRRQPSHLVVRVAARSPIGIQFHEENWFDRLCKGWGIAREHQTGDREFDGAIYVRCESDGFARQYLENAGRRRAILALRKAGFAQVQLTGTAAEAHWPQFTPSPSGPDVAAAAGHLLTLADGIPSSDPDRVASRPDPRVIASVLLWMAAVGYALTLTFAFVCPPVRVPPLLAAGAVTFAVVYVAFGWLAARWLRGDSVAHDRWATLLGFGVLLLGAGSVGTVAGVNALADGSGEEVRTVTVTSKRTTVSKRRHTYYATVPDWSGRGTIEFQVPARDYSAIQEGRSRLELTTGRGALGIEWLRSKRVLP